jgi:hypothetical protein
VPKEKIPGHFLRTQLALEEAIGQDQEVRRELLLLGV